MFRHKKAMKETRSTTAQFRRSLFISLGMAIVSLLAYTPFAFANDYQAEINNLEAQIQQAEEHAHALEREGNTLQNRLSIIAAEKRSIQVRIDRNELKRKQLSEQIVENTKRLNLQREALADTLGDMYVDGIPSTIEILASSNTISDYIEKQQYRDSINESIEETIGTIEKLKKQLEDQKKELDTLIAAQKGQRDQLAAKENEQSRLLAATRGREAEYRNLVGQLEEKKQAAEAALAASLSSGSYKVAPVGYVSAGSVVGAVGNTGLSSGPHLHLEARVGGATTNPDQYIRRQPINMPPGFVSQSYGNADPIYRSGYHPGTDYATNSGAPIFAIDSGNLYRGCSDQLLGTRSDNAYGYVAIVEHASGVVSVYAHMSGGPGACNYNTYY